MTFARVPVSNALVCGSEVCRCAAVEDANALSRGALGIEAATLLAETTRLHPSACAYCGAVSFAAYRMARRR